MIGPFLANQFMTNALAAGIVVSIACGIVGTFMVLRGLAFIGDALAHGVLPGIAVALLLGCPGILGAAVGSALMVGGIGYITRRSRLSNDTAIGLFFVGMLALGVIIVSRSSSFSLLPSCSRVHPNRCSKSACWENVHFKARVMIFFQ